MIKIKMNDADSDSKIFITGVAGFIGFHVAKTLLQQGYRVVGVDNMCELYYQAALKKARCEELKKNEQFEFFEEDLCDYQKIESIWKKADCTQIVHLAAHAAVMPSFDEPFKYALNNTMSTQVVLELARKTTGLKSLLYASTSSVYGRSNAQDSLDESKCTNTPISIYGASKVANEAMVQAYVDRYDIPATGLRFFKVYGPWGRPDTVFFKFVDKIYRGKTISLYNFGNIRHSFTYIDDVILGLISALHRRPDIKKHTRHPIYNLGNPNSIDLNYCVEVIEDCLGKKAEKSFEPLAPGDRSFTKANIDLAKKDLNYNCNVNVEIGLKKFVDWYVEKYIPLICG